MSRPLFNSKVNPSYAVGHSASICTWTVRHRPAWQDGIATILAHFAPQNAAQAARPVHLGTVHAHHTTEASTAQQSAATIVSTAATARPTPTMHPAVHMRAQSNALRSCPPNASQDTLSRTPAPSRGPPKCSSTSDTGRCSVSSRRLDDCSGWFSSFDPRIDFAPAHGETQQSMS